MFSIDPLSTLVSTLYTSQPEVTLEQMFGTILL